VKKGEQKGDGRTSVGV